MAQVIQYIIHAWNGVYPKPVKMKINKMKRLVVISFLDMTWQMVTLKYLALPDVVIFIYFIYTYMVPTDAE